jgi:CoA:oxalate CoA-transferase
MLKQPLEGIRAIDLSRFIAGPYCTAILADMGAEVIEIERPGGAEGRNSGPTHNGENITWQIYHRNKKAVTLNLRADEGKCVLRDLIRQADIVVENFRPGTITQMGFGYEALKTLKPDIILVSISGFGQQGPYAQRPGFDAIAQAMSGLMTVNGEPDGDPVVVGPGFLGDLSAGTWAAMGALFALLYRERTGRGQHVDASLLESLLPLLQTTVPVYMATGDPPQRMGNRDLYGVPANAFRTLDGMVYLDAGTEGLFRALFEAMGMPSVSLDERFRDYPNRLANRGDLEAIINGWMSQRSTEEVLGQLSSVVPIGPVRTVPEVIECPQVTARGFFVNVEGGLGLPIPGVPIHLSESPGGVRSPAPGVGQHNHDIYAGLLGYGPDRLAALSDAAII